MSLLILFSHKRNTERTVTCCHSLEFLALKEVCPTNSMIWKKKFSDWILCVAVCILFSCCCVFHLLWLYRSQNLDPPVVDSDWPFFPWLHLRWWWLRRECEVLDRRHCTLTSEVFKSKVDNIQQIPVAWKQFIFRFDRTSLNQQTRLENWYPGSVSVGLNTVDWLGVSKLGVLTVCQMSLVSLTLQWILIKVTSFRPRKVRWRKTFHHCLQFCLCTTGIHQKQEFMRINLCDTSVFLGGGGAGPFRIPSQGSVTIWLSEPRWRIGLSFPTEPAHFEFPKERLCAWSCMILFLCSHACNEIICCLWQLDSIVRTRVFLVPLSTKV